MKSLFHILLVPFFALHNAYTTSSSEVGEHEDSVVFEFSSPSATPSPVSSPSTPRVVTAYETAHLALRGTLPRGPEGESKLKKEKQETVKVKGLSEMEILTEQLKMHKKLKAKRQVQ